MNNSLKLLLCGTLVGGALLTVTAAGAATSPRTTPKTCAASLVTSSKSPIDLNFWEAMPNNILGAKNTGNEASIQALVAAFNKAENGKIVVTDHQITGGYADLWNDYTTSRTSDLPNVMMTDQYDVQSALDQNLGSAPSGILPASTCIATNKDSVSKFLPKMLGSYTIGKTLVAMPYSASVTVMYYNANAFTEAKIKTIPTTMTELVADQKILQKTSWSYPKQSKSGTYTDGVDIQWDPWEITSTLGLGNETLVNNANGHTKRATAADFASDSDLKSYLTSLQEIAMAGAKAGANNTSSPSSYNNFFAVANGKSAVTFGTTAALGTIQQYLGAYPWVKLGVAPIPTVTGKPKGSIPAGGNGLYMNSSNSSPAQEAASWIFIQYLTSAANLAKWDSETGYLPTRSDEVAPWEALLKKEGPQVAGWYEVGYKALTSGTVDPATEGPFLGNYNAVNDDLQGALQALLTSPFNTTPAEALAEASTNATTDIQSYNGGL